MAGNDVLPLPRTGLWRGGSLERLRDFYLNELGFTIGPAWIGVAYQGREIVRRKVVTPEEITAARVRWCPVSIVLPADLPVGVTVDLIAAGKPAEVLNVRTIATAHIGVSDARLTAVLNIGIGE